MANERMTNERMTNGEWRVIDSGRRDGFSGFGLLRAALNCAQYPGQLVGFLDQRLDFLINRKQRGVNEPEPVMRLLRFLEGDARLVDKILLAFGGVRLLHICADRCARFDQLLTNLHTGNRPRKPVNQSNNPNSKLERSILNISWRCPHVSLL